MSGRRARMHRRNYAAIVALYRAASLVAPSSRSVKRAAMRVARKMRARRAGMDANLPVPTLRAELLLMGPAP